MMMIMPRMLFSFLCFVALVYGQTSPDTATMVALRDSLCSTKLTWSDPNPCVWTGLGCDSTSHRVTRIEIGNSETSGALTSQLRNLSSLTVLEVMGNNLTGKIPSFAGLESLERVSLNDNGFTTIDSDFFTGLSSLHYMNLDNNPMHPWEFPLSLRDAKSLEVFSAVNCNLFGTIPDYFLWRLTSLDLTGNHLTGIAPMSSDIGKEFPRSVPAPRASSSSSVGKIVGCVIGIVLGLLLIGFASFWYVKKKMRPQQHSGGDQDALRIA